VPGEHRRRRHAEDVLPGAGEQSAEHSEDRTVGRIEGLTLDLAPRHGHLVAKSEQLDPLGTIGAGEEDDELEQVAHREVSESPELPSCSVSTHRREEVAERSQGRGSPYSTARSNLRAVRDPYRECYS